MAIMQTFRFRFAMTRILVVEDELKVARALHDGLASAGYTVATANDGLRALELVTTTDFDLLVLDVMLPGRSGLDVLAAARSRGPTPILLLTALDAVEDRVRGLDAGADDYLVKPFAFAELLARVRALLRRGQPEANGTLVVADLVVDRRTRTVTRNTRPLELTLREYEMLEYLVRHKGEVVSRAMLARDVWRETVRATSLDNVIDVHIARLRRKVDHDSRDRLIHTVRGVGFLVGGQAP
ncbi:MAG TPA: response regulator transcription factor [Planctomycetota bacterium]|nr:response regulator transcription factor [Planctomycetota bacterium]